MKRTKTNFVTQQQLKTIRGGAGIGHVHSNKDVLDRITPEIMDVFEELTPERIDGWDAAVLAAHSHSNRDAIDLFRYDSGTNTVILGNQSNPINFAAFGGLASGGMGQGGGGDAGIRSLLLNGETILPGADGKANLGTLTTGAQHTALAARVTALENAPAGGVTSFNNRTGAITLTAADVENVLDVTLLEKAVMSLQSQIDSVASRDSYDELQAATVTADLIVGAKAYIAQIEGNAATATNATNATYATYDSASGHISDNFTVVSNALRSLQSQIDSVASRDYSDIVEAVMSLKMWIEDMFEKTSIGIHTKYLFYADGGLASGA